MKYSYFIILYAFLLMGQKAWGDSVTKTVHFSHSELKCETITGGDGQAYSLLSYPKCGIREQNGTPTLPTNLVKLIVPGGATDISVDVELSGTIIQALNARPYPVQPRLSFSSDIENYRFYPCDNNVYDSCEEYPSKHGWISSVNLLGNDEKEVLVEISPLTYLLQENKYRFSEDVTVSVNYAKSDETKSFISKSITSSTLGIPFYDYCVITNRDLKESFNRLIAWKREKGLNAGVVCVEDILNNSQIQGDGSSGPNDNAGKIRQYLRLLYDSQFQAGKQLFVLFGGDSQIVPIRKGRVSNELTSMNSEDYNIPSDWYYSELNTNWPLHENDELGTMSYYPHLFVGRLLCSTSEEVQVYTNKLLCYELNPGNGNTSYLKKGFYLQADVGQQRHMADSVASWTSDIFTTRTIFEEEPSFDSYAPTFPTGNQTIAKMAERYGYATFYSHGSPYCIKTKTPLNNNDHDEFNPSTYAITSVQGADSNIAYETANGLDRLYNGGYPMFMYTASCHSAPFDTYGSYSQYPCIGKSFTVGGSYGGPAMIGNTRLGPVFSSDILQKLFFENLMETGTDRGCIGNAFTWARYQYSQRGDVLNKKYMVLTANLIGCPEMRLWTDQPGQFSYSYNPSYGVDEYSLYVNNSTLTHTYVGMRSFNEEEESYDSSPLGTSGSNPVGYNPANKVITLHGRNYLPVILPVIIQNTLMEGTHYLLTKDVVCGSHILPTSETWQSTVVFKNGSDYTFEKKGNFTITKGVVVEKGAKLKIINSTANY